MILAKLHLRTLILIAWDYLKGMWAFRCAGDCVAVFGSARLAPDSAAYKLALSLGSTLGRAGFTVMTGGGPGLMEAANRGAREAAAKSLGCHLKLPFESPNEYMDCHVRFRYLLTRKITMFRRSSAFVVLPGGLGTMDELFELLTLIKTKKFPPVPIVMLGREYWKPLIALFDSMLSAKTIDAYDVSLLFITDDLEEAMTCLKTRMIKQLSRKDLLTARTKNLEVVPGSDPSKHSPRSARPEVVDQGAN